MYYTISPTKWPKVYSFQRQKKETETLILRSRDKLHKKGNSSFQTKEALARVRDLSQTTGPKWSDLYHLYPDEEQEQEQERETVSDRSISGVL